MVLTAIVSFVISLLLTAAAIYVGASVLTNVQDYGLAVMTAFIGALAWVLLGWIPIVGFFVALIAYLTVVNFAYPGGYLKAAGIALIAWIVLMLLSAVLWFFGLFVPF